MKRIIGKACLILLITLPIVLIIGSFGILVYTDWKVTLIATVAITVPMFIVYAASNWT